MDNSTGKSASGYQAFQRGFCLGMALFLLLLVACSEKNEDAPFYNQVHPESWNNTQYVKAAPFHGTEVENRGDETCAKCHDLNGEGGETMPGCYKCHFGSDGSRVPPGSDWVHGQNRHDAFEKDQDVCNACHDQGRTYGTGPTSCHDCHEIEDHVLGQPWLDSSRADYHGNQSLQECSACHELSIRCSQCHFGTTGSKAPTGSGWLHGLNGEHETFEGYIDTCNQCHALTKTYRSQPDPDTCHDCHGSGTTHALGQPWLDSDQADYHGIQPQQDCADCHNPAVRCSQCHFGTTGSKAPTGSGWIHGLNDEHETFEGYIDTCNQCHALTKTYRSQPDPATCHDCHGSGTTHVLGQPWLDSYQADYHGDQPQENCATCHDLSVDCNQCHFGSSGSKSPPGSGWPHSQIDNHNDQQQYQQVCIQCHTLTQSYRNDPDDPHCLTCHD